MVNDILPDSRLRDPKATVMVNWATPGGGTVRLELEPIYCFNCGVPNGYVPRAVMSFVSWLCRSCSEKWGEYASNWSVADEAFWSAVGAEMEDRFGRSLTQLELETLAEQGRLGSALEKLGRESPYKTR